MNEYISVLKKYAVFAGRASRREYWMFFLFNILISIVLSILNHVVPAVFGILYVVYTLATLVPGIAVTVRRLHDTNHSGWWMFILLVPVIGVIVLFIFSVMEGASGTNQYGQNPKELQPSAPAQA